MPQGVIPSHMIETMVTQGQISISEPLKTIKSACIAGSAFGTYGLSGPRILSRRA